MKVFFVTKVPMPSGMASTKRIIYYAKGLAEAGANVEILVLNRTENKNKVVNNKTSGILCNNCLFKYFSKSTIRPFNLFLRKFYDFLDLINCVLYLLRNADKSSIIYNYGDGTIIPLILIFIAKVKGAYSCRELCEYPRYTVKDVSSLEKIRSKFILKYIFPLYDFIIPISEELYQIAKTYGKDSVKLQKIPILIDVNDTIDSESIIDYPYIFHSGKFDDQKDGFFDMLKAFTIAHKELPNLHFISTGVLDNIENKEKIQLLIKENSLDEFIHFLGYLSYKDLLSYQNSSLLFIINKLDTFQNRYCFATKLGEYLLTGRPVITTTIGEANYYLKDNINAIIINPGNIKELSDAIILLAKNESLCSRIGNEGKKVALDNFDYRKQGVILFNFFNNRCK